MLRQDRSIKIGRVVAASFNEFYAEWKDVIKVTTSPALTRDLYFVSDRDWQGFDILPGYIESQGVDWSIAVAGAFETSSALAARLDGIELAKFRMIFDRHIVNLSKAKFDEDYHKSSDERALFLVYHRVPPVRICSAMARVKNVTFDFVASHLEGEFAGKELDILSALSTMFFVELNHIMRVYIYFERFNPMQESKFQVVMAGDDEVRLDYEAPTTNGQMSYPDKSKFGQVELF